ncbi:MAG: malonyl-ACP O-methyltransferase BioC [Candidatus Accumulibacter sp.]|jgi:malonyl-CoA O-methyltransferase|nr:malonyl-ACP O-methyltransferase BioC [Accumulibacter sp.]
MNAPLADARQAWRSFQRAAPDYDAVSFLQREIGRRMLERLDCVKLDPGSVLDLGCGTGASLHALRERYRDAVLVGADFSENMLRAGYSQNPAQRWLFPQLLRKRVPRVAADAVALPFANASMGLIWSNMMFHWLGDPLSVLREIYRILETGGLLMFSTLGPDTLKELRACFTDGYAHTQHFIDMHDYGDMLVELGYRDPVMDVETLTLTYPSPDDLFRELRLNGAACAATNRRRGLTGRAAWRAVEERYLEQTVEGRLCATFEIVYGHAWKMPPTNDASGNAILRFMRSPA